MHPNLEADPVHQWKWNQLRDNVLSGSFGGMGAVSLLCKQNNEVDYIKIGREGDDGVTYFHHAFRKCPSRRPSPYIKRIQISTEVRTLQKIDMGDR